MKERIFKLKNRIRVACEKAGRDPESVKILAVSKGHSEHDIKQALECGLRDFGENYAKELDFKLNNPVLKNYEINWHFIGRIQSNKIRSIADVPYVHTLSELRHAAMLSEIQHAKNPVSAFLQINLGEEEQRSGVSRAMAVERYLSIMALPHINLCGLMTIVPVKTEMPAAHWFKMMQEIKSEIEQNIGREVPELSMGMSSDFEEAILYGATWIRVGTLIFGER